MPIFFKSDTWKNWGGVDFSGLPCIWSYFNCCPFEELLCRDVGTLSGLPPTLDTPRLVPAATCHPPSSLPCLPPSALPCLPPSARPCLSPSALPCLPAASPPFLCSLPAHLPTPNPEHFLRGPEGGRGAAGGQVPGGLDCGLPEPAGRARHRRQVPQAGRARGHHLGPGQFLVPFFPAPLHNLHPKVLSLGRLIGALKAETVAAFFGRIGSIMSRVRRKRQATGPGEDFASTISAMVGEGRRRRRRGIRFHLGGSLRHESGRCSSILLRLDLPPR